MVRGRGRWTLASAAMAAELGGVVWAVAAWAGANEPLSWATPAFAGLFGVMLSEGWKRHR